MNVPASTGRQAAPPPTGRRRWWARLLPIGSRLGRAVGFWGRSLLFRVVVLTLVISTVVLVAVGFVLQSQITSRLLDAKINAAVATAEDAANTVSSQLNQADVDDTILKGAMFAALDSIGSPSRTPATNPAGSFEPVILLNRSGVDTEFSVGPIADVPQALISRVADSQVAHVYTSIDRNDISEPALVVGSPVLTSTATFSVFLIFPLTAEQGTVTVVQNTLLLGGGVLIIALTLIALVVAIQTVRPVRRAAAVARRVAGGDLGERMPVKGSTELAIMARSFNGMADALRAQIRQLEEFGKLQRQFTSDVSHELRTPVTTVRMAADLLHSSREDLPPHLARSTELLVGELDRFETLLADLLEISRYDAGMAELAAELIDMRGVIDIVVESSHGLARNAGTELRWRPPADPVLVEIDNRRVSRILRNLVNNAIDHAEGLPVEIELAADDNAVAVSVTDHGVGLKPGEAGLVFNRFWRADPSRQRQTGGTGLGLAIALEDARLHGGWLQAYGRPGLGSRFRLTLPVVMGTSIDAAPLPLRVDGDEEPVSTPPADSVDVLQAMARDGDNTIVLAAGSANSTAAGGRHPSGGFGGKT